MKSIILFLSYSLFLPFLTSVAMVEDLSTDLATNTVEIELINAEDLDFKFSIDHKTHRDQVHIKSDEPIRSMRLMDSDKKKKSYNAIGSNLVILPMKDFTLGQSHFLEIKFINVDRVVMAKITVKEDKSDKSE